MDPGVRCHGMKANPTGYLWSKSECFLMSDEWLPRYRLLENFTAKWNGNAYDRGDYNSSFALRAVELKILEQISAIITKYKLRSLFK